MRSYWNFKCIFGQLRLAGVSDLRFFPITSDFKLIDGKKSRKRKVKVIKFKFFEIVQQKKADCSKEEGFMSDLPQEE